MRNRPQKKLWSTQKLPPPLSRTFGKWRLGSRRAILALRESYRNDLRKVKNATDFQYVRFHAILHDEVGIYDEDKNGSSIYNFSYVDQIYDGLLKNGVRPFVEITLIKQYPACDSAFAASTYFAGLPMPTPSSTSKSVFLDPRGITTSSSGPQMDDVAFIKTTGSRGRPGFFSPGEP